mgnify:CR=1 FL=1
MFEEIKEVNFDGYKVDGTTYFMSFRDEKFKIDVHNHTSGCPTFYEVSLDYWMHGQGWLNITTFCTYKSADVDIDNLMEIAYMFIPGYIKPKQDLKDD